MAMVLAASPASAHAFGTRYDLPIPLGIYLAGAGAAVLLSFIVMARFLRLRSETGNGFNFDLLTLPGMRWLDAPFVHKSLGTISVAVFGLLLAAGFFGNDDPLRNFAPTFVWIVWWVGMAFVCALVGNLWALVNPWSILFALFSRIAGNPGPILSYPAWLDRWPAVGLLLIFAWIELIFENGEHPPTLAALIFAYSILTWIGMGLFGRESWLKNCEIFTAVFDLLSRFAPTVGREGEWQLRAPAVGLIDRKPASLSAVCFVLLLLTTVTFDGVLQTPMWAEIMDRAIDGESQSGLLIAPNDAGTGRHTLIKTMALAAMPCMFIAIYAVFCHAVAMFGSGGRIPTRDIAGYFVLSLVPIAIAYHLSHYISYLLITGQQIIPLASDPFGRGWNLLGTAAYKIDIGILNAKIVWYISVTAIVVGHVFAVYLAHVAALWVFEDRGAALRSQIPMLVLMIGYTMISLWILSQPIVN
ncbi:MAG TPA: hypothetical protein EYQ81_03920 [Sneathiellales bacterium]|nr:hypothetical protein [Sneathiellales bacterium]